MAKRAFGNLEVGIPEDDPAPEKKGEVAVETLDPLDAVAALTPVDPIDQIPLDSQILKEEDTVELLTCEGATHSIKIAPGYRRQQNVTNKDGVQTIAMSEQNPITIDFTHFRARIDPKRMIEINSTPNGQLWFKKFDVGEKVNILTLIRAHPRYATGLLLKEDFEALQEAKRPINPAAKDYDKEKSKWIARRRICQGFISIWNQKAGCAKERGPEIELKVRI